MGDSGYQDVRVLFGEPEQRLRRTALSDFQLDEKLTNLPPTIIVEGLDFSFDLRLHAPSI